MDTNLHIVTTREHILRAVRPGERLPSKLCVCYSAWGVSTIGTILPGFHIAYLPLSEIVPRPIATAPRGAKLLLRPCQGIWVVGTITIDTRDHFDAWAPLPKLPPELKSRPLPSAKDL